MMTQYYTHLYIHNNTQKKPRNELFSIEARITQHLLYYHTNNPKKSFGCSSFNFAYTAVLHLLSHLSRPYHKKRTSILCLDGFSAVIACFWRCLGCNYIHRTLVTSSLLFKVTIPISHGWDQDTGLLGT